MPQRQGAFQQLMTNTCCGVLWRRSAPVSVYDSVRLDMRGLHHSAIPLEIGFDSLGRLLLGHLPYQFDAGGVYLLPHARVLEHLLKRPIASVEEVRSVTRTSYPAANDLVGNLVKLEVLREITGRKRHRRFRYEKYFRLFDEPQLRRLMQEAVPALAADDRVALDGATVIQFKRSTT